MEIDHSKDILVDGEWKITRVGVFKWIWIGVIDSIRLQPKSEESQLERLFSSDLPFPRFLQLVALMENNWEYDVSCSSANINGY